jgi:hypothetical protein
MAGLDCCGIRGEKEGTLNQQYLEQKNITEKAEDLKTAEIQKQ